MDNTRSYPHMQEASVKGLDTLLEEFNVKIVLEYGSGYSTYYFSDRVDKIYTVEHQRGWKPEQRDNIVCIFTREEKEYVESVLKFRSQFDLILIDGWGKYRPQTFEFTKKLDWKVLCIHDWGRDRNKYDYECYNTLKIRDYGSLHCFINKL